MDGLLLLILVLAMMFVARYVTWWSMSKHCQFRPFGIADKCTAAEKCTSIHHSPKCGIKKCPVLNFKIAYE